MDINTSKMTFDSERRQEPSKNDSSKSRKESVWWEGYPTPMDAAEAEVDRRAEERLTKKNN